MDFNHRHVRQLFVFHNPEPQQKKVSWFVHWDDILPCPRPSIVHQRENEHGTWTCTFRSTDTFLKITIFKFKISSCSILGFYGEPIHPIYNCYLEGHLVSIVTNPQIFWGHQARPFCKGKNPTTTPGIDLGDLPTSRLLKSPGPSPGMDESSKVGGPPCESFIVSRRIDPSLRCAAPGILLLLLWSLGPPSPKKTSAQRFSGCSGDFFLEEILCRHFAGMFSWNVANIPKIVDFRG